MSVTQQKVVRVLIVDDSRVVAEFLTHLLESDPQINVVGTAFDGDQAVEAVQRTKPDVVTMDIHMPRVNGYEATRRIMQNCPTPIVVVSGTLGADEVSRNFHAMDAGALAVVARPAGLADANHTRTAKELIQTVKLMSEVKVVRRWASRPVNVSPATHDAASTAPRTVNAVIIGASTGGPIALQTILSGLPRPFAVPILIVQHMAPGFVQGFTEWLGQSSRFAVRVATQGEALLPGHAYVAPDNFQMGITRDRRILLTTDAKENGMSPAVSFLFRSAKQVFGANLIAVVLTGMGTDGAQELKELKERGAITIVQDRESSVVFGMPGEAIKLNAATHVMAPEAICRTLTALINKQ